MDLRALLDANVLWSPQQRNLVLQVALKLDLELHWTALIVEEWLRNVEPDQREKSEKRTIPLMRRYFPRAQLPPMPHTPYGRTDAKDRHVAAAAVHVAPSTLVTWNLKDFDAPALRPLDVEVRSPDQFLSELYDRYPDLVMEASREAQANLSKSAPDWETYLAVLSGNRLTSFVERLARHRPAEEPPADDDDADDADGEPKPSPSGGTSGPG